MKPYRVLALAVIASFIAMSSSCVTTTTTVTSPDGTVTVTKTSGPDADSINAVGGVAAIATKVIVEK